MRKLANRRLIGAVVSKKRKSVLKLENTIDAGKSVLDSSGFREVANCGLSSATANLEDLGKSRISTWPRSERPREKLCKYGEASLSDAELLALFVGNGIRGMTAIDISRHMLTSNDGLRAVLALERDEFCAQTGVGEATFALLQAALELSRRHLREKLERADALSSPQTCRDYLSLELRDKRYECFHALFLDSKHRVIRSRELFRGTIDHTSVPIREVVVEALKHNAAAMIVAHNHPSGNPEPSAADKQLTARLLEALSMVGVKLLDHFVVGDGELVSFAERDLLS